MCDVFCQKINVRLHDNTESLNSDFSQRIDSSLFESDKALQVYVAHITCRTGGAHAVRTSIRGTSRVIFN